MSIQQEKFKAIADKIREKTGSTDKIIPNEFVDKIDDVYESGKKSEYDAFWDEFQQNGLREKYHYAFAGFFPKVFNPKYDIKPISANNMFNNFNNLGVSRIDPNKDYVDLVELLEKANVTLDFSNCTDFQNWIMWANISRLGIIDCKSLKGSLNCYYAHQLLTIDKLIVYEGNKTTFNWQGCTKLMNIIIDGVIETTFDIRYTTVLTHDSLMSIINALSTTTSGLTITFSKQAVNNAFGINVDDPSTYPEGSEFYNLRNSKSNWTFNYA